MHVLGIMHGSLENKEYCKDIYIYIENILIENEEYCKDI